MYNDILEWAIFKVIRNVSYEYPYICVGYEFAKPLFEDDKTLYHCYIFFKNLLCSPIMSGKNI